MSHSLFIDNSGVTVTFLGHSEDAASRTTYTFAGMTLDPAADYIVASISWEGYLFVETLTSVTIDGVAATLIDGTIDVVTGVALYIAPGQGNATGSVVAVISGSGWTNAACATFSLTGWSSLSATSHTTSTANPPSANLSVEAGGAVIAAVEFSRIAASATTTWTGLTERSDAGYDTIKTHTTACDSFQSANASLTVTATPNGSTRRAAVFAVFNP